MSKTIEIPNVPDELYSTLQARAVRVGMSLAEYLLAQMEQETKPTLQEHAERMGRKPALQVSESPAAIIRDHRDCEG